MNSDWLMDPLFDADRHKDPYQKLLGASERQQNLWQSFHFSTRMKLDASDYFCRQAIGAAIMPYEQGLPLLAHRLLKWNLDAFFFELTSAADILLQELNIIYAFDDSLEPDAVRWPKIKTKIPEDIRNYMDNEWLSLWFQKVLDYRNQATHQSYIWTSFPTLGSGNWDIEHELKVDLYYFNKKSGKLEHEPAAKCKDYLAKMVQYIHSVWQLIYDICVAKEIDKE